MDRRHFIKLTAVTGATSALAACGNPEHVAIRFLPEEEITPGIADHKPSVCPLCASGCGLTVRIMDADVEVTRKGQAGVMRKRVAKKLEGNVAHPVSQGRLCTRGQAAIQVTYHPDRIAQPLKRSGTRGDGKYDAITWEQATAELLAQLDRLVAGGRQQALAFLTRPGQSHRHLLVEEFLKRYGAPPPVTVEFFSNDVLRRANALSFGHQQLPTFDLGRTHYVLNFGADFLGTWNSPVAQSVAYGTMRQGRPGIRGRLVQIESRMSLTGASADQWVGINPGTEGVLALGLARVIMTGKLVPGDGGRAGRLIEGWSSGLADYTPDKVETITGVSARRIERLAREFAEAKPAVAMVAGPALGHTNGLVTALAVNALNALVGSVDQPGGLSFTPQVAATASSRSASRPTIDTLASSILAGGQSPVDVLLVDGPNPVFTSPRAWRVKDALEKVPFIASFGSFLDETSILSDLILPDHSFLESWVDALPESGATEAVASVAAPVMLPLYDTRAMPDVLLDLARRLRKPLSPALPASFEAMLQGAVSALPGAGAAGWDTARTQGGWWGRAATGATSDSAAGRVFPRVAPTFDGDAAQYPFHFLPYPSQVFLDGSLAHLPWLQEQPDPMTSAMWSSWVEINTETAGRLGIAQGDVVEIASARGAIRAPAIVSPGLAPNVVAMPVGQGHQTFTRYASGRGANPIEILAAVNEPETGALAWAATRVRISKVGGPDGSLIMFAGSLTEHPHGAGRS